MWHIQLTFVIPADKWVYWTDLKSAIESTLHLLGISYGWTIDKVK